MAHATVKSVILPEVVLLICKKWRVDEQQALDMFYTSNTAQNLSDDETGLYGQSALYIYGLFCEEMEEKQRKVP